MRGSSRAASLAGSTALEAALSAGADRRTLAEELLAVTALIDGSATLRRALADPSREAAGKQALAERLLSGKVSPGGRGRGQGPRRPALGHRA